MEISQLRYFAAVAEAGNMSWAARKLGVSQPAISRQIRLLERELGCALLRRHDRGVRLTRAGEAFHAGLVPLIAGLDALPEAARRASTRVILLKIGLVQIAQWYPLIPEVLDTFRRHHPDIDVEGAQVLSRHQPDALRAHEVDIAIGAPMLGIPDGIRSIKLFDVARGIVMRKGHPLAGLERLSVHDLQPYPLMGYSRATWPATNDVLLEEGRRRGVALRFSETFDSAMLLMTRAAATDGLALLPEPGPFAPMEGLVFRPIPDLDAVIPICMCWRADDTSEPVTLFVKQMQDMLRAEPIEASHAA